MIPVNKVILTEEQDAYLRANYATTINHTISKVLGISMRTLSRLAKERGLVKDMKAIEGQRRERFMKSINQAILLYGFKWKPENGMATRFKPGVSSYDLFGREKVLLAHAKSVETRKQRFAEEKARAYFGLDQRTKMRVKCQPKKKIQDRCYLKKRGYVLDEQNNIAYYTDETLRSFKLEAMPKRFYTFKPYETELQ